jgi:hypothetical protein
MPPVGLLPQQIFRHSPGTLKFVGGGCREIRALDFIGELEDPESVRF